MTNRRAVIAFAGHPQAERRGRTDRGHPYDALGYGCGAGTGPYAIPLVHGGPRCKTAFFVDVRSGRLGLFYTTQSRYVESHGVRVGMATATAERLLRQRVIVGCIAAIRLSSRHALLTVAFAGGTITHKPALRSGHVSLFALHGDRHDPGLFECM